MDSMTEHEKWLARRVYHETFSKPSRVLPNWQGSPNRCNCGCCEEWVDRVSPINCWRYLNPATYTPVLPMIHQVFRALHEVLSFLPQLSWLWFRMTRAQYRARILANGGPDVNASAAIAIACVLLYGVVAPMIVVFFSLTWLLTRPGGAILMVLEAVSIALYVAIAVLSSVLAATMMSMAGIVVIIAGIGSVVYFNNISLGVLMIGAGVLLQYDLNRRHAQQLEERFGRLVLLLQQTSATYDQPTHS